MWVKLVILFFGTIWDLSFDPKMFRYLMYSKVMENVGILCIQNVPSSLDSRMMRLIISKKKNDEIKTQIFHKMCSFVGHNNLLHYVTFVLSVTD